jgi:hypothetical protein
MQEINFSKIISEMKWIPAASGGNASALDLVFVTISGSNCPGWLSSVRMSSMRRGGGTNDPLFVETVTSLASSTDILFSAQANKKILTKIKRKAGKHLNKMIENRREKVWGKNLYFFIRAPFAMCFLFYSY